MELLAVQLSDEGPLASELAGPLAARLSRIDILREVAIDTGQNGLFVMYIGDAEDLEQAVSDLVPLGVRALEEIQAPAGQPVGMHMLEILPGDVGRASRPDGPLGEPGSGELLVAGPGSRMLAPFRRLLTRLRFWW